AVSSPASTTGGGAPAIDGSIEFAPGTCSWRRGYRPLSAPAGWGRSALRRPADPARSLRRHGALLSIRPPGSAGPDPGGLAAPPRRSVLARTASAAAAPLAVVPAAKPSGANPGQAAAIRTSRAACNRRAARPPPDPAAIAVSLLA